MHQWLKSSIVILTLSCSNAYSNDKNNKNDKLDKLSYSLGVKSAENFKTLGMAINAQSFTEGFIDSINNKKLKLSEKEINVTISDFHQQQKAKSEQQKQQIAQANLEAGEKFLQNNKTQPAVITTASGLQYKILTAGTGEHPKSTDAVTVHYRGTLIDGTEFDSSYKRNQPATFRINDVIPAWQEVLPLMQVGSKWQLFIPSSLAYGKYGAGPIIKPNSVLIFEVELLGINN